MAVKEVAHQMNISISTVECHLATAYIKLEVHNVIQLAMKIRDAANVDDELRSLVAEQT
jgi:DNA-binding NarL/FixJ family response regulator